MNIDFSRKKTLYTLNVSKLEWKEVKKKRETFQNQLNKKYCTNLKQTANIYWELFSISNLLGKVNM